jgi:hypothetical protein
MVRCIEVIERRVEEHVEQILLSADRKILRSLSPRARCIILLLRTLSVKPMNLNDIEAHIESYGFKCKGLKNVIEMLKFYGLIEGDGSYKLSEAGEELSAALREYLESLRSLAYSVIEGTVTDNDIMANLITVLASTLGFIDVYVEDPSLTRIYVPLHVYISGLSALVLASLARISAKVYDVLKRFLEEKV